MKERVKWVLIVVSAIALFAGYCKQGSWRREA